MWAKIVRIPKLNLGLPEILEFLTWYILDWSGLARPKIRANQSIDEDMVRQRVI